MSTPTPTIFGREPAVIVGFIQAFLALLVSFGALTALGIKGQPELMLVMGVVIAAGDLYVAYVTRATLLAVVLGFIKAGLAFLTIYGFQLDTEQTGAVIAFATVAIGLYQRTQTEPLPKHQHEFDLAA